MGVKGIRNHPYTFLLGFHLIFLRKESVELLEIKGIKKRRVGPLLISIRVGRWRPIQWDRHQRFRPSFFKSRWRQHPISCRLHFILARHTQSKPIHSDTTIFGTEDNASKLTGNAATQHLPTMPGDLFVANKSFRSILPQVNISLFNLLNDELFVQQDTRFDFLTLWSHRSLPHSFLFVLARTWKLKVNVTFVIPRSFRLNSSKKVGCRLKLINNAVLARYF